MKVLILGGTGFLGRHIVYALKKHEVTVFTRSVSSVAPSYVRWIKGERAELPEKRDDINAFGPDVVIDMGAQNQQTADIAVQTLAGISAHFVPVYE